MKKHRIAALAAALCLLCTGIPMTDLSRTAPITASAAAAKLTYGDLTYTVADGCVTISGCDTKVTETEIPSEIDGMPVTRIGSTAFYGCALTSIVIPEGVTEIESGAFWHSAALADVKLPSTLTTIQGFAFNDCAALADIAIPESVTYIGNAAFGGTPWIQAQYEKGDFVIVNGIVIDATRAVDTQIEAFEAEKERIAQEIAEAKIWHRAMVITNQIGYFTTGKKEATFISDASGAVDFQVLAADGTVVFSGTGTPMGADRESGDTVQVLDFTAFQTPGTYSIKTASGEESRSFKIGVTEDYSGLMYDALNYFYQNRSGIAIEEQYITSGDTAALAREAGHLPDVATIQNVWMYKETTGTQDVTGGWYDAGDHGKYTVNGGIALWVMQNQYERALAHGTADAYQDGAMKIPENQNGYPDLLDEARWEMEWMLKMIVQDGDCAGMAYHKVNDKKWTAIGLAPADDVMDRWLIPPTTAATLNLAAAGAQAYRLWKDLDPAFAEECLTAAKNAYAAAKAHPDMYSPNSEVGGGGAYGDTDVTDEFYWAACELYASTRDTAYYDDLKESKWALSVPADFSGGEGGQVGSFDWGHTAAPGTLTLKLTGVLNDTDEAVVDANLEKTADTYVSYCKAQGYGLPFKGTENKDGYPDYPWGSNSFIADDAIILAYAYDSTGKAEYLDGVTAAMDYILGRNPLDFSYVSGYGVHSLQYPHHRYWAIEEKDTFPKAPCGVLSGGPNSNFDDPVIKLEDLEKGVSAPQLCYVDDVQAYSVNECAINWNSPLAWVTGFLCEQNGGIAVSAPSAGKQIPEPVNPEQMPLYVAITLPEGITGIGEQIFGSSNGYVNEVHIPDGVSMIGKEAFYRCESMDILTLPESVEQVGDNAFADTPWLKEQLADSPLLILNNILIDGTTAEGDVVIPDGVTAILANAFHMNKKLTSVTIPETVTRIGASAFEGCTSLSAVSLPESLRTIEKSAFDGAALTELTIPAGVTAIGDEAFVNNKSLESVTVLPVKASIGREAFGCTSTFTANGQYSYIFVHKVLEDFVVKCREGSTADAYAKETGLKTEYFGEPVATGGNGDVDGNGKVELLDVIMLNKNLLGMVKLTDDGTKNADVNGDSLVDGTDSLFILKSLVSLVTLPL